MLTAFDRCFGGKPELWARAPGRVDLMGSHTDYNLGYVLTMPISRDTTIAARPREDTLVRLYSINLDSRTEFDAEAPGERRGDWSDYPRGVAKVLAARGLRLRGFDGVIESRIPLSGGLSSSAALECAIATLFQALGGWTLPVLEMARLCQEAENSFVGVQCGILDQYTSCAGSEGHALLLDCLDLSSRAVRIAPSLAVVICDTRSKRELAGSEYGKRRLQCEQGARLLGLSALRYAALRDVEGLRAAAGDEVYRRCRFIVEESARVPDIAGALSHDERDAIQRLTAESFDGARDLYEIVSAPMEQMMRAMLAAPGAIGARQAGAGFGGCMVAFVDRSLADEFCASVRRDYAAATGREPCTYVEQPSQGARLFSPGEPA